MQTQAMVVPHFNVYALSEQAITIEFGLDINEDTLQKVTAFNQLITQNPFPGFYTTVPAYTTLTIFFDPLQVIQSDLPGTDCFDKVSAYLTGLKNNRQEILITQSETITIPVCYGGLFGPDIEEVAIHIKLTPQEVISLHSKAIYKVYMIGFVPGFAYLGGMDEALATPRKATPRQAIPVGSVGIAGMQTGVYPLETPGGWQIIGRTPLKMFNANRPQPSLLKAGDRVIFKPIDKPEFDHLANNPNADKDH
jgi:inhibitor of KinA